ncbi:DNA polymerase I [Halofilum ochraceum]|uniref:DNA polymerase I n=1 Tax=Halofilum ochraceum TaxID=1611323 RepID=UPI0008DA5758|nr:DNA polymerase I [Halofilum ochraceum]
MAEKPPLILVDGSSYLYRAYHALPALTNSAGEPTGAAYGVVNMLKRLLADYGPERMAVVFDAKGPTFRSEIYAEYKAHRPPMPDDLASQIEPLKHTVQALGLPLLSVEGVEADDVIGTLACRERDDGGDVLISTGDKDLAQLVDDRVTLVNTMNQETLDTAGVEKKFGIPPDRIIDYLALVGDTSDNIPGVPKCGPKTAVKWLSQYGSLDGVIEHADEVGGKIGENLRAALDDVRRARDLVTIRCDLDLEMGPDDLTRREPDTDALRELYGRMEFRSWLEQLGGATGDEATTSATEGTDTADGPDYETVLDEAALDAWIERLEAAELFAFDTETTSLEAMSAELVGLSFAVEAGHAAYVPVAHSYPGAPEQLDRKYVLDRLRPLLEDEQQAKVGQNLKYDMNVLANHGVTLRGIRHDTMLESYDFDATATRHDMDSLAKKYLGMETTPFKAIAGTGKKQLTFDQVGLDEATPYAAEDADITLRLHEVLWPRLSPLEGPHYVYENIDMPLVPVLARMERTGVAIDTHVLDEQSRALAEQLREIESQAHAAAGGDFNLNSPKQLQEILFERLQIPPARKTPGGQPSTAEDVLETLAGDGHELPRLILDYRGLAKLKSTYTDALPARVNPRTGRVHTSYHQAVASTGRLSSTEPNLQNIPIRTEQGRRIREAFTAPEGYRLLAADYSQIELRIMAHLSGDAGLLAAFAAGRDVHRATAAEVFGHTPEHVTDDQRRAAKAINFGLIYGMSAWGLARQLGIPRGDAQAYVDRYFERYPGVRAYMDATRERAREQGFVETVFGRRLYVPEINARNGQRRQYAERTAINAPMQGSAADIIKRAMIDVDAWLQSSGADARLTMQVHDELILEVPENETDAFATAVAERMGVAAELAVPLLVETGIGRTWAEAH